MEGQKQRIKGLVALVLGLDALLLPKEDFSSAMRLL